jgi:hypothetical protein
MKGMHGDEDGILGTGQGKLQGRPAAAFAYLWWGGWIFKLVTTPGNRPRVFQHCRADGQSNDCMWVWMRLNLVHLEHPQVAPCLLDGCMVALLPKLQQLIDRR